MTSAIEQANATVTDLRQAQRVYAANVQRIEGDRELTEEGKRLRIAALTDGLEQKVIQRRERLLTSLRASLSDAEGKLAGMETASRIQPRTTDQWHTANVRAKFVKEDADRLASDGNPGAIVGAFRRAMRDENETEAYLWLRYGKAALKRVESKQLDRLEAEAKSIESKRMETAGAAQVKLELEQSLTAIAALEAVRTPSEVQGIQVRFGIA